MFDNIHRAFRHESNWSGPIVVVSVQFAYSNAASL